jgi:hypothetical protein
MARPWKCRRRQSDHTPLGGVRSEAEARSRLCDKVKPGPCRATGQRGADVAQRSADTKVRIKGDELAVLLAAVP